MVRLSAMTRFLIKKYTAKIAKIKNFVYLCSRLNAPGVLAHLARARHWQCRGERFESAILHPKSVNSDTDFRRTECVFPTHPVLFFLPGLLALVELFAEI